MNRLFFAVACVFCLVTPAVVQATTYSGAVTCYFSIVDEWDEFEEQCELVYDWVYNDETDQWEYEVVGLDCGNVYVKTWYTALAQVPGPTNSSCTYRIYFQRYGASDAGPHDRTGNGGDVNVYITYSSWNPQAYAATATEICSITDETAYLNVYTDRAEGTANCVTVSNQSAYEPKNKTQTYQGNTVNFVNTFAYVNSYNSLPSVPAGASTSTMPSDAAGIHFFDPNQPVTINLTARSEANRFDAAAVITFPVKVYYNNAHFASGTTTPTMCTQYAEYEHYEQYAMISGTLLENIDDMIYVNGTGHFGSQSNIKTRLANQVKAKIRNWQIAPAAENQRLDGKDPSTGNDLTPSPSHPKWGSHRGWSGYPVLKPGNFPGFDT